MEEERVQELAEQLAKNFVIPNFKHDIMWDDGKDDKIFFETVANALAGTDIDIASAKITEIQKNVYFRFIWYVTVKDNKKEYPVRTVLDLDLGNDAHIIIKSEFGDFTNEEKKKNRVRTIFISIISIVLLIGYGLVNFYYSAPFSNEACLLALAIEFASTIVFFYAMGTIRPNNWQCGLLLALMFQTLIMSTGDMIDARMYGENYHAIKLVTFVSSFFLFNAVFLHLNSMAKNKADGSK